jgi:hypothetical protein
MNNKEHIMDEKYLHEITIWVRTAGILMIVSIIMGIVFAISVNAKLTTIVSPPSPTSNCMSIGGTDPSC